MAVKKKKSETAELPSIEVFDRAHLAHYTMNNAELEREIIGLFLQQLPATIKMIEDARTVEEWRLATHTLKGSAASIGARRLHSQAVELEMIGFNSDVNVKLLRIQSLHAAAADFRDTVRHITP